MADCYVSALQYDYEDDAEIDAIEWNWGNNKVVIDHPWGRAQERFYFDTSKAEKIFDYLLEKGHIKMVHTELLSPEERKGKKYCKMHNSITHSTNECKVFRQQLQKAIESGKLAFDTSDKMKIDGNPFAVATVGAVFGKTKVLTSEKAKELGSVDSSLQLTAEEYRQIQDRREKQKSRLDIPETSRAAEGRPRITSRILLNKWQREKDKNYIKMIEEQERQQVLDEERYERKQDESHWNCPFFRHCWNEGLRLPTRYNCPECNGQYREYQAFQPNRRSVHERLGSQSMDRRINKVGVHNRRAREYDEHAWQEGQWCPGGLF